MATTITFRDAKDQTKALAMLAKQTQLSVPSMEVSTAARQIVSECPARDDECELQAIFEAVKYGSDRVPGLENGVRYTSDSSVRDQFFAPHVILRMCQQGACAFDCLPDDTLLLKDDFTFIRIADVRPGDRIMGEGQWVEVVDKFDKGIQEVLEFELTNGGVLRCTADHRVFRIPRKDGSGNPVGARADAEEIRASDLRPGDDLLTAENLPFGTGEMDPERAWLMGVHIADGWVGYSQSDGRPLNFSIAGKDGHPKEEQKRRVADILAKWSVASRWHERQLTVSDEKLAGWLAECGRGAKAKHVPSLNWNEPTVRALISGLNADADLRNQVFGTISEQLSLQMRVLYRMLGVSTHLKRVDDHGGLGKNPIYRVTPRLKGDHVRGAHVHARVKSISEGGSEHTFDISVEGHRFYLPETDLVVHNCDDGNILVAALCASVGFEAGLYAYAPPNAQSGDYEHVMAVVKYPKHYQGSRPKLIPMDVTVERSFVGWAPPPGRFLIAWL